MKKNKLKEIRESKRMNVEQMAKLIGVNFNTYYKYETGQRSIPINVALKISKVLNISINDIFLPDRLTIR